MNLRAILKGSGYKKDSEVAIHAFIPEGNTIYAVFSEADGRLGYGPMRSFTIFKDNKGEEQ